MVTIEIRQLDIPAGQQLLLHDISWQKFEAILEEFGDRRSTRLAYFQGTLEMAMPLPEHEVDQELIGDMVKILLEELEIDCECFGSTTFKEKTKKIGVEADQCFYIFRRSLVLK